VLADTTGRGTGAAPSSKGGSFGLTSKACQNKSSKNHFTFWHICYTSTSLS